MNEDRPLAPGSGPCDDFTARVDELLAGRLAPGEAEALQAHAAACSECRALLGLLRRLRVEEESGLAARVPRSRVAAVWPAVEARLPAARRGSPVRGGGPRARAPRGRSRLVPLLAAAVVLLVLASGYLATEVGRLRRGHEELRAALAAAPTSEPGPIAGDSGGRAFALASGVTVAELEAWLQRQPPDAVVLGSAEIERLAASSLRWRGLLRQALAAGVRPEDGLQAAEALLLLSSLDLDAQQRLPGRGALRRPIDADGSPGAMAPSHQEDRT